MRKRRLAKSAAIAALVCITIPSLALAAGLVPIVPQSGQGSDCNGAGGCQSLCDLAQLANNILTDAIYVAVFLSAILFAWAGWLYLTSAANSGGITRAKEIFFNVAVGLVIILVAWLVVDIIMRTLAGASLLPWNKIC